MIYTAPYVRFLMRADTLCGEVGVGLALEGTYTVVLYIYKYFVGESGGASTYV
jgi:hypothetical protein